MREVKLVKLLSTPRASALQLVVIFRVGTMNVAALLHKSKLLAKSNS